MNNLTDKKSVSETTQCLSIVSFERFVGSVARFLAKKTAVDASRIGSDFDFVTTGLLDSISTIELFFFLQDTFDQNFLTGEVKIAQMNTPAKLYSRYLELKSQPNDSK